MKRQGGKSGGASKKMKKFPKILDYLESYDPEMWGIINDLAMHGALTPRKGGFVTFLNPDAAYKKEIRKVLESDDPEPASDMLSSLILLDLFETPQDFAERKDDIPTSLGTKLTVKGVSGTKVNIDDGELTLDTKFKPFSRSGNSKRGNLAVWNLKGEVKYAGAPKSAYKYQKEKRSPSATKTGSGENDDTNALNALVKGIEFSECDNMDKDKKGVDGKIISPMCDAVCRVLRYFDQTPEMEDEYKKARCLVTLCPLIDFYLLFRNPRVFHESIILNAYTHGYNDQNVDFLKNFTERFDHPALKSDSDAMVFDQSRLARLHELRDIERCAIADRIPKNMGKKIKEFYDELDKTNKIQGEGPIYPRAVHNLFLNNPGLHLMLDEFSFMMYKGSKVVYGQPTPQTKAVELKNLLNVFYECYGNLRVIKTLIDHEAFYISALDPQALYEFVLTFWKTFGLHTPMGIELRLERVKYGSAEAEDIHSRDLVDVDEDMKEYLDSYDNSEMVISPRSIAELKAYKKRHNGKLPADLDE
jgi:hypothetical protein